MHMTAARIIWRAVSGRQRRIDAQGVVVGGGQELLARPAHCLLTWGQLFLPLHEAEVPAGPLAS